MTLNELIEDLVRLRNREDQAGDAEVTLYSPAAKTWVPWHDLCADADLIVNVDGQMEAQIG